MTTESAPSYEQLANRVDAALRAVQDLPEESRSVALKLKEAMDELNKAGLTTLVRAVRSDPDAREVLTEALTDPALYSFLALNGIVRKTLAHRVAEALELVRPYVASHGGDVELVDVQGDVALVKMLGACQGCGMSAQTLKTGIEDAIRSRVPEITRVEEVKSRAENAMSSLMSLVMGEDDLLAQLGWVPGPLDSEVQDDEIKAVAEAKAIVLRSGGELRAYVNVCPHQGMPLDSGVCVGGSISCAWHGLTFDALTGEGRSSEKVTLSPLPVRVEAGRVWVRPE